MHIAEHFCKKEKRKPLTSMKGKSIAFVTHSMEFILLTEKNVWKAFRRPSLFKDPVEVQIVTLLKER